MKYFKVRKKIGKKLWGYIAEIDDKKKQVFQNSPIEKMVENIAWSKLQKFAQENKIDISKEKKKFDIEYLGDNKKEVFEKFGLYEDGSVKEQKNEKKISIKKNK